MTDERFGDQLWETLGRLPDGEAGIVLRHYKLPPDERRALAVDMAQACRVRGLVLAVASDVRMAEAVGADLVHNPRETTSLPISMSVHTPDQAARARDVGAALAFVSPIFATRSHQGQPPLGSERAVTLAKTARVASIALGGMDAGRFAALPPGAFHGWAAIDAWLG
jgi:thiamine-phosphate pyrophosphorylase